MSQPSEIATTGRANISKHMVVFALFFLSMITYVDRTSISTAKGPIAAELNLSDSTMGMVFSAFALGYALFQLPAGWMADKAGPRIVLAGTVGFWSILTVATGLAWSLATLLGIRFLFGAGEAAVFPASARVIHNWLKPGERGRANGALFAGSRLGAALSYPLLVWMFSQWSWRKAFWALGCVGLVWSLVWLIWFRDYPANEPTVHAEPAWDLPDADMQKLTQSKPLLLAMFQYFASNFTNFICLSWMFPYLKSEYHLTNNAAAIYSMAPLLLGATSLGVTGWAVDHIYSSSFRAWSRRIPGILGFILAAVGLFGVTRSHSTQLAVLSFTVAIFGADMTIGPSWVFCGDIAGKRTGGVSGALNMCGSIGAFASANAFPFLERRTGSSSTYFVSAALLDIAGVLCWIKMLSVPSLHAIQKGDAGEDGQ